MESLGTWRTANCMATGEFDYRGEKCDVDVDSFLKEWPHRRWPDIVHQERDSPLFRASGVCDMLFVCFGLSPPLVAIIYFSCAFVLAASLA